MKPHLWSIGELIEHDGNTWEIIGVDRVDFTLTLWSGWGSWRDREECRIIPWPNRAEILDWIAEQRRIGLALRKSAKS